MNVLSGVFVLTLRRLDHWRPLSHTVWCTLLTHFGPRRGVRRDSPLGRPYLSEAAPGRLEPSRPPRGFVHELPNIWTYTGRFDDLYSA